MKRVKDVVAESEPDYRFTLANERTFLAWIRTALCLLAGAVAVHQLMAPFPTAGTRSAVVLACVSLSVVLACGAYFQWRAVQRAMRRDEPLPSSVLVPVLAVGAGTIALLTIAALILS
ncbi:YidH family protein [Rhodococcus sp. NPDC127528]|uniref:YidH family protein n=1 Tax=unclassified Rhodococcus (in: high G+C Gram-positive bacteria) TaxID=192944 RepID=UPI00364248B7